MCVFALTRSFLRQANPFTLSRALPNEEYPSSHLCLMAEFRVLRAGLQGDWSEEPEATPEADPEAGGFIWEGQQAEGEGPDPAEL